MEPREIVIVAMCVPSSEVMKAQDLAETLVSPQDTVPPCHMQESYPQASLSAIGTPRRKVTKLPPACNGDETKKATARRPLAGGSWDAAVALAEASGRR